MINTGVYQAALSMQWAIEQPWLNVLLGIASGHGDIEAAEKQRKLYAVELLEGEELVDATYAVVRNGVAIIPILGPIIPRATMFSRISAVTSIDLVARDYRAAIASDEVHSIIPYFDTPGGAVKLINATANLFYGSRGQKPVKTFVAGGMNSAGYWFGSGSDEIIVDATASLGSLGILIAGEKRDAQKGVTEWDIISSRAPKKNLDPTTIEGREEWLQVLNATEEVMFQTVARNRGVTVEHVAENFGQGGIMIGQDAVDAGLADRLGSLEDLITELAGNASTQQETFFMNATNKSVPAAEQLPDTVEAVKLHFPLAAQSLFDAGVASIDTKTLVSEATATAQKDEQARLSAINKLTKPGFEAIIQKGIDDGSEPGAVALALMTEANERGVSLEGVKEDSSEATSTHSDNEVPDAEANLLDNAFAKVGK